MGYFNGHNQNTASGESPYGLNDMAGNVWEWVNDWYSENYYENSPYKNPIGPDLEGTDLKKVIRGGAFNSDTEEIVTTIRDSRRTIQIADNVGFRCALTAPLK